MSDPSHIELGMGGDMIGAGGSSPAGKISPVNIPPAVEEEQMSPTDEDILETPMPARNYIRNADQLDDDDDDDDAVSHEPVSSLDVEFLKRVLLGKDISPPKNRRTYSCEQSSSGHLWSSSPSRVVRMNPRKRTSAPQFGRTNTIRNTIVLRSRRSWPVAPPRIRSQQPRCLEFYVTKTELENVRY
ncbi:unnamed protein product [Orchesella dallaii]|uniref:Uncharacterized protein n=1 Tax=Orchesella dallaii TaxID=48710 RepID=A0ABP1Q4A7_9HEXA